MIMLDGVVILAELETVIEGLQMDLHANGINLLSEIKDTSNNIMVSCPVHANGQEHHPSCGILKYDMERNGKVYKAGSVNCFTCGYKSDLAQFVSLCWGTGDRNFGKRYILRKYNTMETVQRPNLKLDVERKPKGAKKYNYINELELDKYRYTCEYLYSRKFNDITIGFYEFGYDIGHNAVTIPIRDHKGGLVFIKRRLITPFGDNKYMNQKGIPKQHIIYGLDKVLALVKAINNGTCRNKQLEDNYKKFGLFITEGEFNTAYLMQNGYPAVSLLGRVLFEDKTHKSIMQKELLERYGFDKFTIWMDNDKWGQQAKDIIIQQLNRYQLFVPNYAQYSDLDDANDYTCEQLLNQQFIPVW